MVLRLELRPFVSDDFLALHFLLLRVEIAPMVHRRFTESIMRQRVDLDERFGLDGSSGVGSLKERNWARRIEGR